MSPTLHRIVFWVGVAGLIGAHMWPRLVSSHEPTKLWFGWLPSDMAYHLLWIIAAALWVAYMTGPVWASEEHADV